MSATSCRVMKIIYVSVLCLLSSEAYADGVPEQDFPVKAASRSGNAS